MSRANAILTGKEKPPVVLLTYSPEQSAAPLVRHVINSAAQDQNHVLLISFLHPPSWFIGDSENCDTIHSFDLTGHIPGYFVKDDQMNVFDLLKSRIDTIPRLSTVVFDSSSTLCEDLGSVTRAYNLLKGIVDTGKSRPYTVVFPVKQHSLLLAHLQTSVFCHFLVEIVVHSPALILEIAKTYLTLPPPNSSHAKFWSILKPLVYRSEGIKLIFGKNGPGCGYAESVLEIKERTNVSRTLAGGHKSGFSRKLEAWSNGPCELGELTILSVLGISDALNKSVQADTVHPYELSFNVHLTPAQEAARSQVPLPYLHKGESGRILYDPDSADDLDDDDPDEDLEI